MQIIRKVLLEFFIFWELILHCFVSELIRLRVVDGFLIRQVLVFCDQREGIRKLIDRRE